MSIALETPKSGTAVNIGRALGECEFGGGYPGSKLRLALLSVSQGEKGKQSWLDFGQLAWNLFGIDGFRVEQEKNTCRLVAVDWDELGADPERGATNRELWQRGHNCGLKLCPQEAAVRFLISGGRKKIREYPCLRFMMEPIFAPPWITLPDFPKTARGRALADRLGRLARIPLPHAFVIARNPKDHHEVWLDTVNGDPDCFRRGRGSEKLVFATSL